VNRPKVHVKKGDTVLVTEGKDKGKRGKVLRVIPREQRVIVEGVNMIKKHVRPTRQMMQGGIIDQEGPIHASNVALVCTKCGEPTRYAVRILDGRRIRRCKKCGEDIDR